MDMHVHTRADVLRYTAKVYRALICIVVLAYSGANTPSVASLPHLQVCYILTFASFRLRFGASDNVSAWWRGLQLYSIFIVYAEVTMAEIESNIASPLFRFEIPNLTV